MAAISILVCWKKCSSESPSEPKPSSPERIQTPPSPRQNTLDLETRHARLADEYRDQTAARRGTFANGATVLLVGRDIERSCESAIEVTACVGPVYRGGRDRVGGVDGTRNREETCHLVSEGDIPGRIPDALIGQPNATRCDDVGTRSNVGSDSGPGDPIEQALGNARLEWLRRRDPRTLRRVLIRLFQLVDE